MPKLISESIMDNDIRNEVARLSKEVNVIVLSPSRKNAGVWSDFGGKLIDSRNMSDGIEEIKSSENGLYIILNKYDGIDLPNDACRVLVIDGLPNIVNMSDRYEKSVVNQSNRILQERIQKIEQGMGRGVRSSSDYCIVFLLGNELTDAIYSNKAYEMFSDATKAQFELSQDICEDAEGIEDIIELVHKILDRDEEWVSLNKDIVSQICYSKQIKYNELLVNTRKAFNLVELGQYTEATEVMCKSANCIEDENLRGYYEQQRAEYLNLIDRSAAQQLLISAKGKNQYLLNPIEGMQKNKLLRKFCGQTSSMIQFIKQMNLEQDRNRYILFVNDWLDKLVFEENTHEEFEEAIKVILNLIGFVASRPEKETGVGPDDFCSIAEKEFLIIECKNEVVTNTICKHDCNQLNGSFNWFANLYPMGTGIPIMIHKSNIFEYDCSPRKEMQILTEQLLEKLKYNIKEFAVAFSNGDNFLNHQCIEKLLKMYKLDGSTFLETYTCNYKKRNK